MDIDDQIEGRPVDMNIMPIMCGTCPFRPGSKYANLVGDLAASALTNCSRVCHQTGSNAINACTGKPPVLCRGARNVQLEFYHAIGFIKAATDEAWDEKCREMKLKK